MQIEHVSVDEAIARLLNLAFVPAPFSVLDLLEGFLLQAEQEYETIPTDPDHQMERNSHHAAMQVCAFRLNLGRGLVDAIESEIKQGNLIAKDGVSSVQLLSWTEVKSWAEDAFGLSVVDRAIDSKNRSADLGLKGHGKSSLDQEIAKWGPEKIKNLLVTFYALALDTANRHPKTMLTATREVQIQPLAEEVEGILNKYTKSKETKNHSVEAIKRRLMSAEIAWHEALKKIIEKGK